MFFFLICIVKWLNICGKFGSISGANFQYGLYILYYIHG